MTTVILGVGMFTFTIVALVGLLMLARHQLVATGDVTITVNGDPEKALCTSAGGTLLATLAANHIFIPSACGGKGSCGRLLCHGDQRRRRHSADRAEPHLAW